MTKNHRRRESAVIMSSVMPSLKYSCSGSPDMLVKGRTAIEGFSGRGGGALEAARGTVSRSTSGDGSAVFALTEFSSSPMALAQRLPSWLLAPLRRWGAPASATVASGSGGKAPTAVGGNPEFADAAIPLPPGV